MQPSTHLGLTTRRSWQFVRAVSSSRSIDLTGLAALRKAFPRHLGQLCVRCFSPSKNLAAWQPQPVITKLLHVPSSTSSHSTSLHASRTPNHLLGPKLSQACHGTLVLPQPAHFAPNPHPVLNLECKTPKAYTRTPYTHTLPCPCSSGSSWRLCVPA